MIIIPSPSILKKNYLSKFYFQQKVYSNMELFILIFNPELPFYFLYHPCIRQYRRRPKSKPNKFYQHVSAARSLESKRSYTCTIGDKKFYLHYTVEENSIFERNIKYKTNYFPIPYVYLKFK